MDEASLVESLTRILDIAEQEFLAGDEPGSRKRAQARAVIEAGWRPQMPEVPRG